jgi:micrococcal nuclease
MVRLKRSLLSLLAAVTMASCSSGPPGTPRSSGSAVLDGTVVTVEEVTDGDTFHANYLGREERIRLIGVNTPEVPWYGGKGECYGVEAGLYARSRLDGQRVRLEFDQDLRDRYGRILAYVYVGDELFNLTLVSLGYATADPVPPDTRMAAEFSSAEAQAKAAGLGLWSACPSGG